MKTVFLAINDAAKALRRTVARSLARSLLCSWW